MSTQLIVNGNLSLSPASQLFVIQNTSTNATVTITGKLMNKYENILGFQMTEWLFYILYSEVRKEKSLLDWGQIGKSEMQRIKIRPDTKTNKLNMSCPFLVKVFI